MAEVLMAACILAAMLSPAAAMFGRAWHNRSASRQPHAEPAAFPAPIAETPRSRHSRGFLDGIYIPDGGRVEQAKAAAAAGDFGFVTRAILSTLIDLKHVELDEARDRYHSRMRAASLRESPDV